MIPLPLENLPDILESTPKPLFSERLHAFQAHKLEPKLFAIVNKLFYRNILHESLLLCFCTVRYCIIFQLSLCSAASSPSSIIALGISQIMCGYDYAI